MRSYPRAAWERAMKREEIILRAYAKKISWTQAAEVLGYSPRHLRRLRDKYDEWGFDGLHDGRVGKVSPRRIEVAVVEEVLRLYRDEYFDFNVVHFHEKLVEKHEMTVSYTWVKKLLQGSGLVAKDRPRKKHRRKRERKPVAGMMLHIDGSKHQWFGDERWYAPRVLRDWRGHRCCHRRRCRSRLGNCSGTRRSTVAERLDNDDPVVVADPRQ